MEGGRILAVLWAIWGEWVFMGRVVLTQGVIRMEKDLCHAGVEGCEGGRGRDPLRPFLYR